MDEGIEPTPCPEFIVGGDAPDELLPPPPRDCGEWSLIEPPVELCP